MAQSLAQIYLHIIFSTKNREPFLTDRDFRRQVHGYVSSVCRSTGSSSLAVGGVEDHLHILCLFSRTCTVADLVKEVKRESSLWIKDRDPELRRFFWQEGYGAFSLSPSHVERVSSYIRNQEKHHRHETFQDEYRRILDKYGVAFEERYVWD